MYINTYKNRRTNSRTLFLSFALFQRQISFQRYTYSRQTASSFPFMLMDQFRSIRTSVMNTFPPISSSYQKSCLSRRSNMYTRCLRRRLSVFNHCQLSYDKIWFWKYRLQFVFAGCHWNMCNKMEKLFESWGNRISTTPTLIVVNS